MDRLLVGCEWFLESVRNKSLSRRRSVGMSRSGSACSEPRKDSLQKRQHHCQMPCPNDEVPKRFELFPSGRIGCMAKTVDRSRMRRSTTENRSPFIEILVGLPVSGFEGFRRHPEWTENGVTRVIEIPISVKNSLLVLHSLEERCSWIRCKNMKRRRLDAVGNRPIHGSVEDTFIVSLTSENEATVDDN